MNKLYLLLLVLVPSTVFGQTGRWGLIINSQTKQCARFWEGSACEQVVVPSGWKPAFPNWLEKEQTYQLTFGDKKCSWLGSEPDKCCQELGLKFEPNFKAESKKTKLAEDPNSMCYQIQ
jgi:hypothetical protein